jgi:sodium transport system permease protein
LFGFLNRAFSEQAQRPLHLPVAGADQAPNLVDYLQQNNVVIMPAPEDARAAVRDGDVDLVLIIPDDYGDNFNAGRPAAVQILHDVTDPGADIAVERARDLLRRYSSQIGSLRLLARGVSPALATAVPVEMVNVATQDEVSASVVLNLLPVVMITATFFGGFYLAVDMTAGERERHSLEPLLTNPVPRSHILLGKNLTALLFTVLATFLATAAFLVLLGIPFIQEFTSIHINLGWDVILTAVALMIPVAFMAVALEMLVASYAESVKEAQTYTQIVALVGFLPAIFLSVLPVDQQPWMAYIPTISQLFLINEVSRGELLDPEAVLIASLITIAVGVVALLAALRLYNTERIILGK